MKRFIGFLKKTFRDRFKLYLFTGLAVLGITLAVLSLRPKGIAPSGGLQIHFFYLPSCIHCRQQEVFNDKLAQTYPEVRIVSHDTSNPAEAALMARMIAERGVVDDQPGGVPVTILGKLVFLGWEGEATTGRQIEEAVKACLAGDCPEVGGTVRAEVEIPLLGKVRLADYSLPVLAIVLGLVDGFNPCAMWVLVYLISLIMTLKDRRRMWLLVGSFVFASGVLYFLFMTAWLNAFLLIGYSRILTIVIGLAAVGAGALNVQEFIKTRGALVCEIGDQASRRRTMSRIERVIFSPLSLATISGIILLAFVVNSIEFACSSALPAIFTSVLAVSRLSTIQHYAYILLYDLCFMLDDLIIFGVAAIAMTSSLGDRYARWGKPVGGAILLGVGALLLFAPNLLR